jgi:hypothetical protein
VDSRSSEQPLWRRSLQRELAALLMLKVAALALLWWLFFSPAHRITVDAEAAGRHLAATPVSRASARPAATLPQESRRD